MVALDERGEFCGKFCGLCFFVVFEGFEDFFCRFFCGVFVNFYVGFLRFCVVGLLSFSIRACIGVSTCSSS